MIKLLHDHLIVRMDEAEKTTDGGLFIPDGRTVVDGGLIWGTVLQVGPGFVSTKGKHVPITDVDVGDRVLFCRFINQVESKKGIQHIMDAEYGPRSLMLQVKDVVCVEERNKTEPAH